MSDENKKEKLLKAKFYQRELEENKRSVNALMSLLEHTGSNHPQYHQLNYLITRNKEIENQLVNLHRIISNLETEIQND